MASTTNNRQQQESVTLSINNSSILSQTDPITLSKKFDPNSFDPTRLLNFDFSLLQASLAYLVKTITLHDKELVEARASYGSLERNFIMMREDFKEFQLNNSKKLEIGKMKKDLEELVMEKMLDYEDQLDMLKKDMQNMRIRASSRKKVTGETASHQDADNKGGTERLQSVKSFNLTDQKDVGNFLGSNLDEIKASIAQQEQEEILSVITGGKFNDINLMEFQDQINQLNERINELQLKITVNQEQPDPESPQYTNIISIFESMKNDFDRKFFKKIDIRNFTKKDMRQISTETLFQQMQEHEQMINEMKQMIEEKANQEDFENLAVQMQNVAAIGDKQYQSVASHGEEDNEDEQELLDQYDSNSRHSRYQSSTNIAKTFDIRTALTTPNKKHLNEVKELAENEPQAKTTKARKITEAKKIIDQKSNTQLILPKAPEENNKTTKIVLGGNSKDAKAIRDLHIKVMDLDKQLQNLKTEQAKSLGEEFKQQIHDLQTLVDKKAGILDLKKNAAITDELNFKVNQLLKDVLEIKQFDLFLGEKGRTSAITLKNLDVKSEGVDGKLKAMNSSMLEIQAKVNDSLKLLMIGANKSNTESDSFLEDKIQRVVREKSEYAVQELNRIKAELLKSMKDLENKVGSKINREELNALDDQVSSALDQQMSINLKKFAEKNELKSLMKDIELQIGTIHEMMAKRSYSSAAGTKDRSQSPQPHEENDVMLATKPLGGWSCGSCGTLIGQINSMPSKDASIWGKLPARDSQVLNQKIQSITGLRQLQKGHQKSQSTDTSLLLIQQKPQVIKSVRAIKNDINIDMFKNGIMTERSRAGGQTNQFQFTEHGNEDRQTQALSNISGFNTNSAMVIQEERPQSTLSMRSSSLPRIGVGKGSIIGGAETLIQ